MSVCVYVHCSGGGVRQCVCARAHTGAWWTGRRGTEQRPRPSALSLRKRGGSERTWRWTLACLNLSVAQSQGSKVRLQAGGPGPHTSQGPAQERLRYLLHGKIWARSRSLFPSPCPLLLGAGRSADASTYCLMGPRGGQERGGSGPGPPTSSTKPGVGMGGGQGCPPGEGNAWLQALLLGREAGRPTKKAPEQDAAGMVWGG